MVGPLYRRGKGRDLVLALRAGEKHCNSRGTEPPTAAVTANLTLDFLSSAQQGDWLEAAVEFHKLGGRVAFGNCYIIRGEERIARASAVFLVTGTLSPGA